MNFFVGRGLFTAMSNTDDERAYYTFDGDLCQMGIIERYLRDRGFPVVKSNVYPGFAKEDLEKFKAALQTIFSNRIDGWWNQERALIEHAICSQEEFDSALGRERR